MKRTLFAGAMLSLVALPLGMWSAALVADAAGDSAGTGDSTKARKPPTATGNEAKRVKWAAGAAWSAAEIMHVTGLPGHDIMVGTLVFAAGSMILAGRRHPVGARRLAVAGLMTGTWVTVAAGASGGVFGGPWQHLIGGPFGLPTLTNAEIST